MPLETVPWFVGGGAEHSPDVARQVAYAATSGAAGVLGSLDFRVTELDVPGTSIRVAAGAAAIPNKYLPAPDYGKQSYIARADDVTDVPVRATGSTGKRSDLVVVRIDDPQFGGQVPADPVKGPYVRFEIIENVPAGTIDVPSNVAYPAVALARLDIPASTGTITQNMIVNLRKLAQPRRERRLYTYQPTQTFGLSATAFTDWPGPVPDVAYRISVPSWATTARIVAEVSSAWVNRAGSVDGKAVGKLRARLGDQYTQSSWWTHTATVNGARFDARVGDTIAVPAAMRGTVVTASPQAQKDTNLSNTNWTIDTSSFTTYDIEFVEDPL